MLALYLHHIKERMISVVTQKMVEKKYYPQHLLTTTPVVSKQTGTQIAMEIKIVLSI
jgi:hypothetical protein